MSELLNTEDIVPSEKDFKNLDLVGVYLSEIGGYDQLTDEDEKRLSEIIMRTGADLNNEEFVNARNELVLHSLKLVVYFAKKYYNAKFHLDDLIQVGNVGLIKAASNFDYTKAKFSTHASYYIIASITEYFNNYNSSYYLPRRLSNTVYVISKLKKYYECYNYTEEELKKIIMEEKNLTEEEYDEAEVAKYTIYPIPLNNGYADDGGTEGDRELIDTIGTNQVEEEINSILIDDLFKDTLPKILTDVEYEIITKRFGICGNEEKTLLEIGKEFGISQESVRRKESRILYKLSKLLQDFRYLS